MAGINGALLSLALYILHARFSDDICRPSYVGQPPNSYFDHLDASRFLLSNVPNFSKEISTVERNNVLLAPIHQFSARNHRI